jgi:hypothetical protein
MHHWAAFLNQERTKSETHSTQRIPPASLEAHG